MDPGLRLLLFIGIFLVAFLFVYWRLKRDQDPEWERRWKQLPVGERKRLIDRARRGETPTDLNEAELIAGSGRYQRTILRSTSHATAVRIVVASILLLLATITTGSPLMISIALALLIFVAWLGHHDRTVNRNLAQVEDLDS